MLIKRGNVKIIDIVKEEENIDDVLDTKNALSKVKKKVSKEAEVLSEKNDKTAEKLEN